MYRTLEWKPGRPTELGLYWCRGVDVPAHVVDLTWPNIAKLQAEEYVGELEFIGPLFPPDGLSAVGHFVDAVRALQTAVHANAVEKGWWTGGAHNDGEKIALMHAELSEALEGLREGNPPDEKVPEYSTVEVELADVVIRILDYVEHKGLDLASAILAKVEYNRSREYKHGGKEF